MYDVPYDSTSLVEDGASSVFGNLFSLKLYFKLYVASNVALSKSTQTFALNEAGAFIAVRGIQGSAFATGSTIAFQIVAAKLPSREITCQLRERSILPYLFTPLSVAVYTNSSTTLQYIDVRKRTISFERIVVINEHYRLISFPIRPLIPVNITSNAIHRKAWIERYLYYKIKSFLVII